MAKQNKTRVFLIFSGVIVLAGVILALFWGSPSDSGTDAMQNTTPSSAETVEKKGIFRVLVAGSDRTTGLSDVLMLISLDRDTGEVWVLQIPRDTYAAYTEGDYRKLNGAPNALGGMEEMKNFLSNAFGIAINRYIRLSPDTFCEAVDAVGGVEIELAAAMDYEDPEQGLSIHLPQGKQILNGKEAEQFVRYRSGYVRGDLGRIDAQKKFLSALFKKVSESLSPMTAVKLATAFLDDMETDLTLSDTVMLATEAFSLEADNVFFVTAPGEEATATVSGASYYVLSAKGMETLLCEHFGGESGCFDQRGLFLNKNYQSFKRIYEEYMPYEAFSAVGIDQ